MRSNSHTGPSAAPPSRRHHPSRHETPNEITGAGCVRVNSPVGLAWKWLNYNELEKREGAIWCKWCLSRAPNR